VFGVISLTRETALVTMLVTLLAIASAVPAAVPTAPPMVSATLINVLSFSGSSGVSAIARSIPRSGGLSVSTCGAY